MINPMLSFYEIGLNLTDKIFHHRYDRFYPFFLEKLRNTTFNMLEIGLGSGGSMQLWKQYFLNAKIYGIDKDICWTDPDNRCEILKCDQSKIEDLEKIKHQIPKCKFIIDDGSHHPYHQFITFNELFTSVLEDGGIYIIEDIECNYWKPDSTIHGYVIGEYKFIDYLKTLPDQINSEFSQQSNLYNISSITFAHNCCIIIKQTEEEKLISQREYGGKDNLPNVK